MENVSTRISTPEITSTTVSELSISQFCSPPPQNSSMLTVPKPCNNVFNHRSSAFSPIPSSNRANACHHSHSLHLPGGSGSARLRLPSSVLSPFTPVTKSSAFNALIPSTCDDVRTPLLLQSHSEVSISSDGAGSSLASQLSSSSLVSGHSSSNMSAFTLNTTLSSNNGSQLQQQQQQTSFTMRRNPPFCTICGQWHLENAIHVYDYTEAVDVELLCLLCQQPLVDPLDTECGHTFCTICLKSRLAVNAVCPVDGCIINFLKCHQPSNLVKRLVDKLLVACPNRDYCEEHQLARSDLEQHLAHTCRGTLLPCRHATKGCPFVAPRMTHTAHLRECRWKWEEREEDEEADGSGTIGDSEQGTVREDEAKLRGVPVDAAIIRPGVVTTIQIHRGEHQVLGISVVGGCDTIFGCIAVQEIYLDGIVARDGRLRPGDELVAVNGVDLRGVTHSQAKRELCKVCPCFTLDVYREPITVPRLMKSSREEQLKIAFTKREGEPLGIKIVGKKNKAGLYILEVVAGAVADVDGRLQKDDRILAVDGHDLAHGTQDEALEVIKSCGEQVTFVVSRRIRASTPDILRSGKKADRESGCESMASDSSETGQSRRGKQPTNVRFPSAFPSLVGMAGSSVFSVTVEKSPNECLGMSIAGGVQSQRGNTPVYVTNLVPECVLARTRRVKKGDLVVGVNSVSLLGFTHEEAVAVLKSASHQAISVTLHLLEGPETSTGAGNFMPKWTYWLHLPTFCQLAHAVRLEREAATGSLGFSIVGGLDEGYGHERPVVVKTIVPGSPADLHGGLRCGDMILAVNECPTTHIAHIEAVKLLQQCHSPVDLQVVSWPGTIV